MIPTLKYSPDFEAMYHLWIKEWKLWCKNMLYAYGGSPPPRIDEQRKDFKLWLSIQKDIVMIDLFR